MIPVKKAFLLLALLLTLAACQNQADPVPSKQREKVDPSQQSPAPAHVEEVRPVTYKATLAAIGDVLIHSSLYKDAYKNGRYDFRPMFQQVKPYLQAADITFANQESMIGGTSLGLSSYPRFNSPHEVGDALKDAGIDIVSMANNHTLDRGEKAIQNAIAHWNKLGISYVGAHLSAEDQEKIRTLTRNGITFSFLAYTYGTNGIPIPKGKPYLVNLIDVNRISRDVERAKQISDVTVVSLHFGNEYQRLPNDAQRKLVQQLADMEVDIVLGHHPHVLQPPAWVTGKSGHRTFVAYSLGNFISGQDGLYKQIGGIVSIEAVKTVKGKESRISLQSPRFLPTYCSFRYWRNYRLIPMKHLTDAQLPQASKRLTEIYKHLRTYIPDLKFD